MKLIKIFFVFLVLTLFSFLLPHSSLADNEFSISANVDYEILENGKTLVTHNIAIENLFSTLYATNYTLTLENIKAQNIKSNEGNKVSITNDGDKIVINITFPDSIVGRGQKRNFFISYENSNFAVKTGEIWEVSIPKLSNENNYQSYNVRLKVPHKFGQNAYMSPEPISKSNESEYYIYNFSKEDMIKTSVTAGFGQFQVFSFNLSYHLENPLAKSSDVQIALPPDTAFQKVFIEKLDPAPNNVLVDNDGNWIATYKLQPRQRMDILALGNVQIFSGYRHFINSDDETLKNNLKPTTYWQSDDEQIKKLASQLKTPEEIYNFVSTKLKYNNERVTSNVVRMGAINALKNPEEAICMEFTDLFIAISRAAGIPAREINGYAYTENKDLQPLGLVADVLHSWPEYFDQNKKIWIPIDPTWAATTGGKDFFNKLDLRHFTFVIHGESDTKPFPPGSYKLGPNPQKDVFVSFGKLSDTKAPPPKINFSNIHTYEILNTGSSAVYDFDTKVYFDNKLNTNFYIQVLPPYANYKGKISIPFSILGEKTPDVITVEVNEVKARIATNKRQNIIYGLVILTTLILVITLGILIKLGKIKINVKKFFTKTT